MTLDVALYMRRARATGNFSIETIFAEVEARLKDRLAIARVEAPRLSDGFWPRVAIARHAGAVDAKLVHVTGDVNFAALGVAPERLVLTVHDCHFLHRPPGLRYRVLKAFWLDRPVRRARVVTTVSRVMADELRAQSGLPLPALRVIPPCISPAFQPRPKAFDAQSPRVLHLGTAPNKNLPRLVEALRGLSCTLVIVGPIDGSLRSALVRHGVAHEQHDALPFPALLAEMERADVLAFPSTYEGFGMPVVEAQTVGRPVLAGDIPVLRETAADGACFVDPLSPDAIRAGLARLLADAAYRDALVARGRANARRFAPDAVAEAYLALYREAL